MLIAHLSDGNALAHFSRLPRPPRDSCIDELGGSPRTFSFRFQDTGYHCTRVFLIRSAIFERNTTPRFPHGQTQIDPNPRATSPRRHISWSRNNARRDRDRARAVAQLARAPLRAGTYGRRLSSPHRRHGRDVNRRKAALRGSAAAQKGYLALTPHVAAPPLRKLGKKAQADADAPTAQRGTDWETLLGKGKLPCNEHLKRDRSPNLSPTNWWRCARASMRRMGLRSDANTRQPSGSSSVPRSRWQSNWRTRRL